MIHLEYDKQLIEKKARVERAFARFGLDTARIQPTIGAKEQWRYRTRTKWTLGNSGSLGLYREGSFDVMDLPHCPVVPTVVAEVGNVLRRSISKALSADSTDRHWVPTEKGGILRGVDLRHVVSPNGAEQVIVSLIFNEDKTATVLRQVKKDAHGLLRENSTIAAFFVVWGEGDSHSLISGRSEIVEGPSELPDVVGETVLLATGGAFVQAHRAQAGVLQTRRAFVVDDLPLDGLDSRVGSPREANGPNRTPNSVSRETYSVGRVWRIRDVLDRYSKTRS